MSNFQNGGGGGGYQGRGGGRFNPRGGRDGGGGRFQGGNRGGGGRFHGGRDGGRGGGYGGQQSGEGCAYDLCKHHTTGKCTFGDGCRHAHIITLGFAVQAHANGANSVGMMTIPDESSNPIPRVITGGNDSTLKIWNLGANPPVADSTYPASGNVRHIEVVNNTVLWSVDEPVTADQAAITVGTIYMLNGDGSTTAIRRSTYMPCTHPMGEIRDFKVENIAGSVFVLSGGAEGMVHTWRYDATNGFEHVTAFDSHFRAVTSVLLHENMLWTGSTDQTIRIWNPATSQCERVLTCAKDGQNQPGPGHTGAVSCLLALPATAAVTTPHIASGGFDGELRLWSTSGELAYHVGHESEIMCMTSFYSDPTGIPLILIGLRNGSILARSRNTMALLFRIDSSCARNGAITAIYDMHQHNSFVVCTDDGFLICWTIKAGLTEPA